MAELFHRQGLLDESRRAQVEIEVASRLEQCAAIPEKRLTLPVIRQSADAAFTVLREQPPSATVAHHTSQPAVENCDDAGRATGHANGPSAATPHAPRFRIVGPHARGGLGEVFLAIDSELDRQVALKELLTSHAHDPVSQSRFLQEARVTGRLEHPGIVPVYGLGRYADGRPYYVMRFIEGETLARAIERFHEPEREPSVPAKRELAFRRLLRSLIDACNAVAYAHSHGVVHRDLKPENIMLGRFGETLVVDWGVAKQLADPNDHSFDEPSPDAFVPESSLTRPGSLIGTPQYMSPEQASSDHPHIEPASDIYSLGATLYCLLVGHGPFATGSVADVLRRVRRGVFPAPRRLRRTIDPALEAICLKAMSLRPEHRHPTPLVLAEEIEAWLADVRYRGEQEQALNDVKQSLARLSIERAQNLFSRAMPKEGMLWLARALESSSTASPSLGRAVRTSLAGWHAAGKSIERTLAHKGSIHAVVFSPDGRWLASSCADHTAQLWDIAKGTLLSSPIHHEQAVAAIAFSPDGTRLATGCDDGTVRQWDALSGAPIAGSIRHDAPISCLLFSPDGSMMATASRSGPPCLWESATGRPIGGPGKHDAAVLAIAFHPDGTRLAAAGNDGSVRLWDTVTAALLEHTLRHEAPVAALAFSPDGRRLVSGCLGGQARLWDTASWTLLWELPHRAEVHCVDFSPGGRSVATACNDGTARLWDAETFKPIGEPVSHGAPVDYLAFNPAGTILATGSREGTVRLWDADTGLPIGPPLLHRGMLHAVAFGPDSRRLATACSDGMVRCWHVPAPFPGDLERINCWVRVATELDFDEGDAIRHLDQLAVWELRRQLHELGGSPVK
jgi:WD40 repeat protein/tRNA A-37 threonylcarbamoyl transferase component Bud32